MVRVRLVCMLSTRQGRRWSEATCHDVSRLRGTLEGAVANHVHTATGVRNDYHVAPVGCSPHIASRAASISSLQVASSLAVVEKRVIEIYFSL